MSHPEMLNEIDRVSGPATRLREIRAALPTARARRPVAARAHKATREGRPAAARAAAPAAAAGALTHPQRLTVIDQALLMLEALYANLPLKRALHAIDPIQRLRLLRLRHEALDEREFQSEMIDIFVACATCTPITSCRRSTTRNSPICRSASRSSTRAERAEVPRLVGLAAQHRGDARARRGGDALERHADRSRGRAQRRARGRQQHGGAARPRPRCADAAAGSACRCRRTKTGSS